MSPNQAGGKRWGRGSVRGMRRATAVVAAVALALAPLAWAERTHLKPGWNLFSPDQDVQVGRQASRQAERQVPMLNDPRVDNYLNTLGHRLASYAPGNRFAYQYKCVNSRDINAFALPGGFVYINRGVIEAADNEAQLAGVMAHETSHVALRHGTNQASKAYAAQVPLAILGGLIGSNSVVGLVTQLGASFTLNSVMLKYSRTDESQADIMGTQILYDARYDPRAMAQFFEKIQAESKGKNPPEFFSDHPNPEHRIDRVDEEIDKLGGPPPNYKTDSPEFQAIKRYVRSLPPPPKAGYRRQSSSAGSGAKPSRPSEHFRDFENDVFTVRFPDNWGQQGQGNAVTFFPEGGVVADGQGQAALAYGVIVNVFEPRNNSASPASLDEATDQLVGSLSGSNPSMRVARQREYIRVDGERAASTRLTNDSPVGGRENDWVVSLMLPEGLLYFVCVVPERDSADYDPAFRAMVGSIRFRR